jgi:hypothetical protein
MAPLTPQITLTATLQDQSGNPIPKAMLIITLCGYGQTIPCIQGTSILAAVGPVENILKDGTTDAGIPLWGNDVITPAGTFYSVAVADNKRNIVQCGIYEFTGSGTIDLSNAPQIIPGPGGGSTPPLDYTTQDLWAISDTVTEATPSTPDAIADAMGWSVNRPVPVMPPRAQTLLAPPGYAYKLTRQPLPNMLLGLYYNGNLQLPSFHYSLVGRDIYLNFYTANGDNLYALYVATTLN